jgi:hypothetical protein
MLKTSMLCVQVFWDDIVSEMEAADLFIHDVLLMRQQRRLQVGVLFVENFLTCGNFTALCTAHCPEEQQGHMVYDYAGKFGCLSHA